MYYKKSHAHSTPMSLKTWCLLLFILSICALFILQACHLYVSNLKIDNKLLRNIVNNPVKCTCPPEVQMIAGDPKSGSAGALKGPSPEYDGARRRLEKEAQEVWYMISGEMNLIETLLQNASNIEAAKQRVSIVRQRAAELKRSLLRDVHALAKWDGHAKWREQEKKRISTLVESRIKKIQNPPLCKDGKDNGLPENETVACDIYDGCGLGCEMFILTRCLMAGYGTKRTYRMAPSLHWGYNNKGWESVFLPVSSCNVTTSKKLDIQSDVEVPYMPMALPAEFADLLWQLNGDPVPWWRGQFLRYLMRYQPGQDSTWTEEITKMNTMRPIVGFHVRGGNDKMKEAHKLELAKYIQEAEEFFQQLEVENEFPETNGTKKSVPIKRRVYLACDLPEIWTEARTKYPQFEFLGNSNFSNMALNERYTPASLKGILHDLHSLASCDFFVGTLSSTVGRMAYELFQTAPVPETVKYWDISARVRTLDSGYWAAGTSSPLRTKLAVTSHNASGAEIELIPGDVIEIWLKVDQQIGWGNLWNGSMKGFNTRTKQQGIFPSFKVDDRSDAVKYPYDWLTEEKPPV